MGSDGLALDTGVRLRAIHTRDEVSPASSANEQDEEEPVTPAGRVFCEPGFFCTILCTVGFQNQIDLAEFKKTLLETIVNHKRFSSIMKKNKQGIDVWVRTEVDIDAHVFELQGFSPSQIAAPSFVENYIAELALAPPLRMSHPLWDCRVVNGTSGDSSANAFFRMHHSLGDGTSLMSLFLACTRRVDRPDLLPSIPTKKPPSDGSADAPPVAEVQGGRKPMTATKHKATAYDSLFRTVWKMVVIIWNTLLGITNFLATVLWLKDSQTVMKGSSGVENLPKQFAYTSINLDDMRAVKNSVNGTINDVFMAIISVGLQRYLEDRREQETSIKLTEGEQDDVGRKGTREAMSTKSQSTKNGVVTPSAKKRPKLETLRIRASALMNTRESPGLQELASMMEGGSQARWGNHMGYLILPIPLKHHRSILNQVRAAKKIGDQRKASLEGIFTYWSGALLMRMIGAHLAEVITRRATLHTTLSVSNVLGPMEPVTLGGNPVTYILPMTVGHPQALCIYLQTYMGKANLIVMTCRDLIPDPETIVRYSVDALQEMKKAAVSAWPFCLAMGTRDQLPQLLKEIDPELECAKPFLKH